MSGGVLPIVTGSVVKAALSPFPSLGVTSTVIRSPFFSPSVLNCGAVAPGSGTLLTRHLYRYVIGSPSMSSPWTSTRSPISLMPLAGKIRAERTAGGWLPVDDPLAAECGPPAVGTGGCGVASATPRAAGCAGASAPLSPDLDRHLGRQTGAQRDGLGHIGAPARRSDG